MRELLLILALALAAVAVEAGQSSIPSPGAASLDPALLVGDMAKLQPAAAGGEPLDFDFTDAAGAVHRLSDYRGKWVLLNFWASWCAPCLKEMPSLDRLQAARGGAEFTVLAISLDLGGADRAAPFLARTGVENLALHVDQSNKSARLVGIKGLPATLLIAPDGREIARMAGPAEWDGPEALAIIDTVLGVHREK